MTKEDIIRMAREAGIPSDELYHPNLERFAALVAAAAEAEEPVAWMIWTHGPVLVFMNKDEANLEFDRLNHVYPEPMRMLVPLYRSPQPAQRTWVHATAWRGLTDEERQACTQSPFTAENYLVIEAKLKEKNT